MMKTTPICTCVWCRLRKVGFNHTTISTWCSFPAGATMCIGLACLLVTNRQCSWVLRLAPLQVHDSILQFSFATENIGAPWHVYNVHSFIFLMYQISWMITLKKNYQENWHLQFAHWCKLSCLSFLHQPGCHIFKSWFCIDFLLSLRHESVSEGEPIQVVLNLW